MGLDTNIRKFFKEHAPGAFQADHVATDSARPWVFINELATTLYKELPQKPDDPNNGRMGALDYCDNYFIKPCMEMLSRTEFSVAIVVLDNQQGIRKRIGKLKDKERERRVLRTDSSKTQEEDEEAKRYTKTTIVSPEGDGLMDPESEDKSVFLINPRIVARHYHLLDKLWEYCILNFTKWEFAMRTFPFNKTFIMDHDMEAPTVFHRHIKGIAGIQPGHLYHGISEGDVATVFWSKVFSGLNVLIRTTDSDVQIIMARFAYYHRNQPDLLTIIENQFSLRRNVSSSSAEFEPMASGKGLKRKISAAEVEKKKKAFDNKRFKALKKQNEEDLVCVDVLKLADALIAFSTNAHKNYLKSFIRANEEKYQAMAKRKKLNDPVISVDETILMNLKRFWETAQTRAKKDVPFDSSLTLTRFFRECEKLIDLVEFHLDMNDWLKICILFGGNDFIDKADITHYIGFYSGDVRKPGFLDWFINNTHYQVKELRELTVNSDHAEAIFIEMMIRFYYDETTSTRNTQLLGLERPFAYLSYCQRVVNLPLGGFADQKVYKDVDGKEWVDKYDTEDVNCRWKNAGFFEMFLDEKSEIDLAKKKAAKKKAAQKKRSKANKEEDEDEDEDAEEDKQEPADIRSMILSVLDANSGLEAKEHLGYMGQLREPLEEHVRERLKRIFDTFITISQYWMDTYEIQPPRFIDPYEPIAMDILCGPLDTRALIADGDSA